MGSNNTVYFITSNEKKFTSLRTSLQQINITIERLEYDFDEGRELSIEAVAKSKLAQAKAAFPGKALIVDDRGFFIPALNGFPGPFVKLLLDSFSYKGLVKLMKGEKDRRAIFSYAVGYFDGNKDHILVADEEGFITESPRGSDLHGWTEILYVYGHPSFPGKSLAELNEQQWQEYLRVIEDVDPFILLRNYLLNQRKGVAS